MRIIIKIAVILLLAVASLWADITGIILEGDRIIAPKTLREEILPKLADADSTQTVNIVSAEISRIAEELGYFQTRFDISINDTICKVKINRNQRYQLGRIQYNILGDSISELEGRIIERFIDEPASRINIQDLQIAIADYYSENGYPFVQIKLVALEKRPPQYLDLNLEITSGPQTIIDSLIFYGGHNLSRSYLLKKTGLERGQYFNDAAISRSIANLNSLPYLKPVDDPVESFYANFRRCLLEYTLERQNSNQIEGAIGYNPASDNRDGYVFGFLNLTFYNPLGDGQDFHLQWNKPGQSSSRLALQLDYPYIFGTNFESVWRVRQERYSDLYLNLTAALELQRSFSPGRRLSGGFSWSKITPQGDIFNDIYHSRIYQSWLGLYLAASDEPNDLLERSISIKAAYLHKRFYDTKGNQPPANSIDPFLAEFSAQGGVELYKNLYGRLIVNFAGFSEDEELISPAEMIKLGGRNTVRGYSEEEFVSPRALWTNLEAGLFTRQSFRTYIFSDLAYARIAGIIGQYRAQNFDNEFLYGAGLGMRLATQTTTLDISAAWSRESTLSQGILYLIVGNKF